MTPAQPHQPRFLRRSVRAGAAVALAGAVTLSASIPVAGQESTTGEPSFLAASFLDGYGWFNKAQQVPTGGNVPNTPPCTPTATSQCPVGPPADGIYVVYDVDAVVPGTVTGPVAGAPALPGVPQPPSPAPGLSGPPQPLGPTAYGAVRFVVPEGAESQLALNILSRSTTTPGGVDPSIGKLFACIVTTPGWLPAQNARYDQGPKYDCTTADQGDIQGDTVTFDLGAAFVQNGAVDVAIVPAGTDPVNGGDRPFQVALAAPTDSSLTVLNAADLGGFEAVSEDFGAFEDPASEFAESFDDGSGSTIIEDISVTGDAAFALDDSFGAVVGAPVARPTTRVGPRQVAVPAGNVLNPFRRDASRGERMLAVALLLAIATGLWWVGGQPVRAPRLLGSLGAGEQATTVPDRDVRARGIGRFARARTAERPPRLF